MDSHAPDPRRWQALALVCVAFFMTVLDVSIVNVALPSIKTSLNVSENTLQWVLIAYTITFGGLLLLGSGAAAGVLFGGILTKYAGWEWIFFVNVPVGALVLALTRTVVRESRITGLKGFDVAGAATITSSLALLVYAISKAPQVGWGTG